MTQEALKLALEALKELVAQVEGRYFCMKNDHVSLQNARFAIARAREALAQTQEPEATIAVRWHEPVGKVAYVLEVNLPVGIHKLYTNPPQRTWVGLTDEERQDIALEVPIDAVFITEAKLKEKNT